jgi:hypothetical protein
VKNWLNNLIRRLGLALLNFSFNSQTKQEQELRSFPKTPVTTLLVWAREEAEVAWKAGRTEVNIATMLPENAASAKSATGRFMVDGRPAQVVLCLNEAVKRWLLAPSDKRLEPKREKERDERKQSEPELEDWARPSGAQSSKPYTCITSSPKRVPKFPPDPEPIKGKTCRKCGGPLVLKILSYDCEPWTDTITPADTAEECLRCGRLQP